MTEPVDPTKPRMHPDHYAQPDDESTLDRLEKPEDLGIDFFEEVKTHLYVDIQTIKDAFLYRGFDQLQNIAIEVAGNERHYCGKVALFITFSDQQGRAVQVVYKPRSLLPDYHLEALLSKVNNREPRTIVDKGDYGYDFRIEGSHPPVSSDGFLEDIKKMCSSRGQPENRNLFYTLYKMGFEDIHGENFILDRNGILHFIDAECYCTEACSSLDSVSQDFEWAVDADSKAIIDTERERLMATLQHNPTRLVFCSTGIYDLWTNPEVPESAWNSLREMYSPLMKLGERDFCPLETIQDYHTCLLAKFLLKKGFLQIDMGMTFNDVKLCIANLFEESDALAVINREIDNAKELNRRYSTKEIPVFHFHLVENWIECGSSKTRLRIK